MYFRWRRVSQGAVRDRGDCPAMFGALGRACGGAIRAAKPSASLQKYNDVIGRMLPAALATRR